MITSLTNNLRLILVFLALLSYGVQSIAFVGNVDFSTPAASDQIMSGCHSDHPSTVQTAMDKSSDCCEDGCSMVGCHAANALLTSINIHQFHARKTQSQSFDIGFIANISSSLYRPPILR